MTPDTNHGGRPSREQILNVFREAYPDEITSEDLAEAFGVTPKTGLNYAKDLKEDGHVKIKRDGKPKIWELADTEPKDPVYHPKIAEAERYANKARETGESVLMGAITVLAAVGLILSYHVFARGMEVPIPFVRQVNTVVLATWCGVASSIFFLSSSILLVFAAIFPRAARWRAAQEIPEDS